MIKISSPEVLNIAFFTAFTLSIIILVVALIATGLLLGFGQGGKTQRSFLIELLMEKSPQGQEMASFSRLSGLIGSMALAALFVGVVFWVQYAIFFEKPLSSLTTIWPAFALGASLYAPYAVNKIMAVKGT